MDPSEDPYEVLGVAPTASAREIRAAYRKAALQHHPDKATDKHAAHHQFTKISAAYELLTEDPQQHQAQAQAYEQNHNFHDPFVVFESVFRQEFGGGSGSGFPHSRNHFGQRLQRPFFGDDDPFGDDFFGGFGRPFARSPFGGGSHFDGDRHRRSRDPDDVFGSMRQLREEMSRQFDEQPHSQQHGQQLYSSTSTSSNSVRKANGETVTTTETKRTVNGKKQHVKEIVTLAADGTVIDRQVTGDDTDALIDQQPQEPHVAHQKRGRHFLPRWRHHNNNEEKKDQANV